MTRRRRVERLLAAIDRYTDVIDAEYWRFCRCARAKPPSLVVPWAYQRRAALEAERERLVAQINRRAVPAPAGPSRRIG